MLTDFSGGGRKTDEETGRSIQGEDQTTSKIGESFTRSKDLKVPIAVISGKLLCSQA